MITMQDAGDTLQSYVAVAMGWIDHYDLMHVGAVVLLICRLIIDIPEAYMYIKMKFKKDTSDDKSN